MRAALLLGLTLLLAGCGLRPLYGSGSNSTVVTALRSVEVSTIDERSGWLLRNALVDRLHFGCRLVIFRGQAVSDMRDR